MENIVIRQVRGRQILDSRGNPTVEADVAVAGADGHEYWGRAAVPSGASTGAGEALELRDGDAKYYNGKSVMKAVWNINHKIADVAVENPAVAVDELLLALDGTENKSNLGANAILAVSLAATKAVARSRKMPLYRYVNELARQKDNKIKMSLPLPMMNVMNGGAHADWSTDFQEYMIVPIGAETIDRAVQMGAEVFHALKEVLKARGYPTTVGDEGGYAPKVAGGNNEPLECVAAAIEAAGYQLGEDFGLALDIAASELYRDGHYELKTNGDWKTADDLMNWYEWILENYPVVSIEDGLGETDWENWTKMTARLGERCQLVGDDLLVTNTKLLKRAIKERAGNAILIKPNQIGTLSETIEAVLMAKQAGWRTIISHRSGETEDVTIAHLAVGLGVGQIKTGSLSRSERVAKYNELMRIAAKEPKLNLAKTFIK